jgi:hypothetical protein
LRSPVTTNDFDPVQRAGHKLDACGYAHKPDALSSGGGVMRQTRATFASRTAKGDSAQPRDQMSVRGRMKLRTRVDVGRRGW